MITRLDLLGDSPHSLSIHEVVENKINEIVDEVNIQTIMLSKYIDYKNYGASIQLRVGAEAEYERTRE